MVKYVKSLAIALVAAAGLAVSSSAKANSIFLPDPPTITPLGGGQFRWDYNVHLANGEMANTGPGTTSNPAGTWFELYDVPGLVSVNSAPPGFVSSIVTTDASANLARPIGVTPPSDTSVSNIRLQYTGAFQPFVGDQFLGVLSFIDTIGVGADGAVFQVSQDYPLQNGNPSQPPTSASTPQGNIKPIFAPVAVPLPAAAWGGLGLLGILGMARVVARRVNA